MPGTAVPDRPAAPLHGRLLILSVLDLEHQTNNREHHLLAFHRRHFEAVDVAYKLRASSDARHRHVLSTWATVRQDGNVRLIAVNPLLNHEPGLAREVTGNPSLGEHPGSWPQRLLHRALSGAAVLKDLAFAPSFLHALRPLLAHDYDACIALGPWANRVARVLRREGVVRRWIYEDRDLETGFLLPPFRRRLAERVETALLREADEVVCIGWRLARRRGETCGREITVIPTGVDLARYAPQPPRRTPRLFFTGNLEFWSGMDLILPALAGLPRPDLRLTVVGSGSKACEARLARQAQELGLAGRVEWLGRLPNDRVPALAAEASIGLACFEPEEVRRYAVPLKLFEYMAAGLAVVATKGTETGDLVECYECGLAVPYTQQAIAGALERLLGDAELLERCQRNALLHVRGHDWPVLLQRELQIVAGSGGAAQESAYFTEQP